MTKEEYLKTLTPTERKLLKFKSKSKNNRGKVRKRNLLLHRLRTLTPVFTLRDLGEISGLSYETVKWAVRKIEEEKLNKKQ